MITHNGITLELPTNNYYKKFIQEKIKHLWVTSWVGLPLKVQVLEWDFENKKAKVKSESQIINIGFDKLFDSPEEADIR